jgi:hypothetical protein
MPAFHENFLAGLEDLGDSLSDYYQFIDDFGTHYVSTVHMGSKFGYTSKLSTTAKQTLAS